MTRNTSTLDRTIRIIIGIVLIILPFMTALTGILGITLAIVGAILLLTGMLGFCPLYRLFGLSTCPMKT